MIFSEGWNSKRALINFVELEMSPEARFATCAGIPFGRRKRWKNKLFYSSLFIVSTFHSAFLDSNELHHCVESLEAADRCFHRLFSAHQTNLSLPIDCLILALRISVLKAKCFLRNSNNESRGASEIIRMVKLQGVKLLCMCDYKHVRDFPSGFSTTGKLQRRSESFLQVSLLPSS